MSNTHQVDISTPEGREQPVFVKTSPEVTIEKGFHYLGWGMLLLVRSYLLMWKTSKYLFDSVKSLTSVDKEIEEQQEAARRIIQAGKENDVDELEITMSEKAGLSLVSSVEGFPVELIAGKSGNMILKVKYK